MARRRVRSGHKKFYDLYKKDKVGRRAAMIGGAGYGVLSAYGGLKSAKDVYKLQREVGLATEKLGAFNPLRAGRIGAATRTLQTYGRLIRMNPTRAAIGIGTGAALGYGGYRLGEAIRDKMQGKDDIVYVYSRRLGRKIPISREKYESWKAAHGARPAGSK